MRRYDWIGRTAGAASLAFAILLPGGSVAQQPAGPLAPLAPQTAGFVSKPLVVNPLTGDDTKEIAVISVSLAPGASSPPHSHPGDCVGAVIEGTMELRVEGVEARRIAAGEGFHNARGKVHQFRNAGDAPVRLLTTIIYDKGKPRVEIQPAPPK
jgi:quercetin dioxygenase-like cupin family protein